MEKNSRIYVAGHNGLVGSGIMRCLSKHGYNNVITKTHKELDLTRQADVENFFRTEKPEYVFLCAAKVGGIHINEMEPAEFIYTNIMIEANVIQAAYINDVRRLLFMGSGCIYPRIVPQPIKEEYLLTAPLEKTNEAYAIAKIAGLKMCEYYDKQFGTNYISVMPCNLYGPGDNYNPDSAHVIPSLIRKFHDAKEMNTPTVTLWGTGEAKREFLHIDDIAEATVFLMEKYEANDWVNIGSGTDITIRELSEVIKEIVGYKGKIIFDSSYPDGTPRKLLDSSKLLNLGWTPSIPLKKGLSEVYEDYKQNRENYRN